ncbi:hypothetical protein FKM82_025392 [Ascaphus truei]
MMGRNLCCLRKHVKIQPKLSPLLKQYHDPSRVTHSYAMIQTRKEQLGMSSSRPNKVPPYCNNSPTQKTNPCPFIECCIRFNRTILQHGRI